MLARCGRVVHICGANRNCTMKRNKNLRENRKNRNCLQNREVVMRIQGFRGNYDSQGKLGMCPSLAESYASGFSKSTVSHETKQKLLLEKPIFRIRQKGVPPLLLPTNVLQLPRCLARTYNLDFHDATLFELDSFKRCNCSRENRLQNQVCFANVGCSPTPRQHF